MKVYLPEKEKKWARFWFKLKFFIWVLAVGFSVIGLAYVVFVSNFFRVNDIVITGSRFVDDASVKEALMLSVLSNSLIKNALGAQNYLFWPKEVPVEFFALLPSVSEASISKDYFEKTITIALKEREKFGIWCLERNCFWFDRGGVIFENAPAAQSNLILTVIGYPEPSIVSEELQIFPLGSKVFSDASHTANIFSAFEILNSLGIGVRELSLSRPELREFYAETYNGAELRFSLDLDPRRFAAGLEKLNIKPGLRNLEYVDMRVENKIFYK
ncbi:hypothetical protein A3A20_00920 [Candidatus Wolfebacteria bacterium RIFCSPLOWO2_01_FULL_45_19]|uniref:POTRA domain-containing protein n=1 Tax=Candidatus Wolfebacteria bacterium RIFCSPLOWO2_01_FULL_45_19 TaxID=1802557 RepID=A0A1F8DPU3_9BACT|nr:MAG: hypothetical protein UX23_C0011G0013 [Parcubacteria group bacterium GW2011_GWB1_45_9]OGM90653.1 MAG: hypothetical protein A3A20_00920 [Candidatus Wolfebacteria bacterium RIFCSPLOWO2_01_FULL_45_19]